MRIRQIVFAAQDLGAARQALARLLALPAPYRDPGVAEFGLDNAVFNLGDQFVEVVSPLPPEQQKTPGADTACGRHLARHGDSGYMLILQTADLAGTRARLASLGVRSVWNVDYPDISATHLHPKDIGAAIVSLDEARPAASWRWGGPDWRVAPGPAGRQRVRGITLRAADPATLARRWAQVLGLAAPQRHGTGWRLALDDGFVQVEATGAAGQDGISGFTLAVADVAAVQAAADALGLAQTAQGWRLMGVDLSLVGL